MSLKKSILFCTIGFLAGASGVAHATYSYHGCGGGGVTPPPVSTCGSETWDFTKTTPTSDPSGLPVEAIGYHQNGTTSKFIERPLTIYSTDHMALNYKNQTGTAAQIADATNMGSGKEATPFHAFDNSGGYDLVVLEFSTPITLSQISMGYVDTDSDFSLFAFTGPGTPKASGQFDYGSMLNEGWTLIGSFDYDALQALDGANDGSLDLEQVTADNDLLTAGTRKSVLDYKSSYWAIGAVYDAVANTGAKYGSIGEGTYVTGSYQCSRTTTGSYKVGTKWMCNTYASGDDRFKIASVAGCYDKPGGGGGGNVPEPSSMALLGIGLIGGFRHWNVRRRG